MKKRDYKNFIKRYDKFKKNNLPTRFFDDERQTLEYVYFYNGKFVLNSETAKDELEISQSLTDALGEIAYTGFYYSYTDKHIEGRFIENGKIVEKIVVGHNHAHSFEEVVMSLYNSPESFSISEDEKQFYSKQELEYLRRVQKYLQFIGMKDIGTGKIPVSRYRNKIHAKYENALIYTFNDFALDKIMKGERNFRVIEWYPEYGEPRIFEPKEYRALIVDKEDNFKMYIEFTHEEIVQYKDIKEVCKKDSLEDDDKLIAVYFKTLETF